MFDGPMRERRPGMCAGVEELCGTGSVPGVVKVRASVLGSCGRAGLMAVAMA